MKIIDGQNAILGRLSSYVAKESLKGEKITIINCDKIIITGNKKDIQKKFEEKRNKRGRGLLGPKIHRDNKRIVKRAIRGMLPHYDKGRGKEALKRIKCYEGIPNEFKESEKIIIAKEKRNKFISVNEIFKK
jgi:large subunit ribosomal protein L13